MKHGEPSIIHYEDKCVFCDKRHPRLTRLMLFDEDFQKKLSEKDGLYAYICPNCQRKKNFKNKLDDLRFTSQLLWMKENLKTENDFVAKYGVDFLIVDKNS